LPALAKSDVGDEFEFGDWECVAVEVCVFWWGVIWNDRGRLGKAKRCPT